MLRKRPPALDAQVVKQSIDLEAKSYLRCDQWKKKYRWTLVNDFRACITRAKTEIITAFELPNKFRDEKLFHYGLAQGALTVAESDMDIMIRDEFGVLSEKEWEEFAIMIYDIRGGLSRLINSLAKSAGGSESLDFGKESVSAGYKDA